MVVQRLALPIHSKIVLCSNLRGAFLCGVCMICGSACVCVLPPIVQKHECEVYWISLIMRANCYFTFCGPAMDRHLVQGATLLCPMTLNSGSRK